MPDFEKYVWYNKVTELMWVILHMEPRDVPFNYDGYHASGASPEETVSAVADYVYYHPPQPPALDAKERGT